MRQVVSSEPKLSVRTLRFSLKFKFLFVIFALLILSLGLYVYFTTQLFQSDKEAYIYETGLSVVEMASTHFENEIKAAELESKKILLLIKDQLQGKSVEKIELEDSFKIFLKLNYSLLFLEVEGENLHSYNYISSELSNMSKDLSTDDMLSEIHLKNGELDNNKAQMYNFKWGPAYLIKIKDNETQIDMSLIFKMPVASTFLNPEGPFTLSFYNQLGQFWWGKKSDIAAFWTDLAIDKNKIKSGVKNVSGKINYLTAYHFFRGPNDENFVALASIPKDKAYSALYLLIQKSWSFGLMVLSFSLIVGLFFSKALTKKLVKLTLASLEMAQGKFDVQAEIGGHDEIAVLGDTFNYMSHEIIRYMDEMKEKIRLQKEIEVAQLVQSRFFPAKEKYKFLDIESFNQSSSECGGDWWGVFEIENEDLHISVVAIGDATGHGVPAALVASCAHSSFYTLKNNFNFYRNMTASELLSALNQALCYSGEKIQMTMALLTIIWDKKSNHVRASYANASHLPTFVFFNHEEAFSKEKLRVLGPNSLGPRLGESFNSKYISEDYEIQNGDLFLCFTDGLFDLSTLQDGVMKKFNQRRLWQLMSEEKEQQPKILVKKLENELRQFQQLEDDDALATEDDISFVWIKFRGL